MNTEQAENITTHETYLEAVKTIKEAAWVYETTPDQPLMDDYTYDMLMRELKEAELKHPEWKEDNSPTETVGAGVNTSGDVTHSAPMLSLDNVFNEKELEDWEAKLARAIGRHVTSFVIEPKLDGLALSARYVDGKLDMLLLRGSGKAGEEVTHNAKLVKGLPAVLNEPVTLEVRGECFMTNADFEKANELREADGARSFVNPRNGAAGSIRAKDRSYEVPLTFLAYGLVGHDELDHSVAMDYLDSLGIAITKNSAAGMMKASNIKEVMEAIKALGKKRPELGFAVDGAVVKADKAADRDEAGFTSRAPRWGIAWKYPPDSRKTVLTDIILQLGRTGAITPVAVLEPVFVGGTTISRATLHNASIISAKDLRKGDSVWVERAGEVVPKVTAVHVADRKENSEAWSPPTECPRCGGTVNTTQKVMRCSRGKECGKAEAIFYFATKPCMDIEQLGKEVANSLVREGLVSDVGDLYSLTLAQLSGLDRLADVSAQNVLDEIEKSKTQPLSRVFAGLGIRLTGTRISKRLADTFGTMEALEAATVEDFVALDGFEKTRGETIVNELKVLKPTIEKLRAAGVNMKEPGFGEEETGEKPLRKEDGTPMSVVVTGAVPGFGRVEAQEAVTRLGGKISSSPSKKTDLVVVGEGAGSKETKARELGLKIMTASDFAVLASK